MTQEKIREKLRAVPEPIKIWFGSEEIVSHVREINEQLGLKEEKESIVPRLLFRLELKDLEPQFFSGELAQELGISKEKALTITTEVKETLLRPIQKQLSEYGIDIFLLNEFNIPLPRMKRTAETVIPASLSSEPKVPSFAEFRRTLSETTSVPAPTPKTPTPVTASTVTSPFVLHEERGMAESAKKDQMKGFSLPFGLFKPKQSEASSVPRVTVEAPSSASTFAKASADKKEEAKTVHYSEYRSNLPSHAGGEFINLETFGVKTRISTNKEESTNITNGTSKSVAKTPVAQLPSYPVTSSPPTTPISSDGADRAGASNISIKKTVITPQTNAVTPLPTQTQPIPTKNENSPKVEGNMVDLRSTTNDV